MDLNRKLLITGLFASLMMLCSLISLAEQDLSSGAERTLNGHQFMPSQFILDPFVGTRFGTELGGATAVSLSRNFYDLNGDLLLTLEGSVFYATLGMNFQQNLGEKWAVGVGGSALIRSGTNAMSFINDGATVNSDILVWGRRMIHRGQKSQLTGGINWQYSTATIFTPRDFANHIIEGGSLDTAPFLTSGKTWSLQADLLWAYAFSPTFGMRANGSFGVQEKFDSSEILLGKNRVGLLGEVNFNGRYGLPLGITLGYFHGFPNDVVSTGISGTVLGFWYTAKQDFVIGLETGVLFIPSDDGDETIDGAFTTFNVKYFF